MRLSRPPAAVRQLQTPERRLAWAVAANGTPLVVTAQALYAGPLRLPWLELERLSWEPPVLAVVESAEVEGQGLEHRWELEVPGALPAAARSCLTTSVAWSDRRAFDTGGAVRLVGRRVPGQDALLWQQVWAPGTDRYDPRLRALADRWTGQLRASIG